MSEADKVNNSVIGIAVLVTAAALIAMVFGVYELFDFSVRAEIDKKVNSVESTQLRQLHVDEQSRLTSYQWVDQKNGVVRVPVERAVELIVAEGYKRPAPVEVAPAPPTATGDGGVPAAPIALPNPAGSANAGGGAPAAIPPGAPVPAPVPAAPAKATP